MQAPPPLPHMLLYKLGIFLSINGPHLGNVTANSLVSFGTSCIKTFGKAQPNQCLRDLDNLPIPAADLQKFKTKINFVDELLNSSQDWMLKTKENGEQMEADEPLQQEAGGCGCGTTMNYNYLFQSIRALDLIAIFSKMRMFEKVILVGSQDDGYVSCNSALAELTNQRLSEITYLKFLEQPSMERYLLVNDKKKFKNTNASKIDTASGRTVHIYPLGDCDTAETLALLFVSEIK